MVKKWKLRNNYGYEFLPPNCPPDVVQAAMMWYKSQNDRSNNGQTQAARPMKALPAPPSVPFVPQDSNQESQPQGN